MGKRILVAVCAGATMLAMAVTAVLAGPLSQGVAPTGVAATPEAAIAAALQSSATPYASDCATASSPQDLGKSCSKFVAQRGDIRAYLTGRTFSEFSAWMFVEQTAGGWVVVSTAPFDGSAMTMSVPWPAS